MTFALTVLYVAISLLSPGVLPQAIWSLHVNIILGIAVILMVIPQIARSGLATLPDSLLALCVLVVACLSIVHLGFSTLPGMVMGFLPILITYYFVLIGCRSLSQLKVLTFVLLLVAVFIFVQAGLADHAHDALSPYLVAEGSGDKLVYRYKGLGVLSDPNDLAQFYATLIPMLFLRWKPGSHFLNFVLTLLPSALLGAGMYFTHSRGGVVALIALILFGFKDKIGLVKSSILAAALFVAMMALNVSGNRGMNDDDGGRVAAWITGLEIFKVHPLLGVGINQFGEYNETGNTAHNSYILVLSEIGIFGYFCWMGMIVSNWKDLSTIAVLKTQREKDREEQKRRESRLPSAAPEVPARHEVPGLAEVPATLPSRYAFSPAHLQRAGLSTPAYAGMTLGSGPQVGQMAWAPSGMGAHDGPKLDSESDLIHAARVMRVASVGLLTSAFFLSRSFSMVFYLVLGMAAALRLMYDRRHSEVRHPYGKLVRAVMITVFGSVLFLYLFVRIRGIH